MHRPSRWNFVRRCFLWIHPCRPQLGFQRPKLRFGARQPAAARRKRPSACHGGLRVEQLEVRDLLSSGPASVDGFDSRAIQPPNWEIVISDDDGTLFGIDPDDMSPIFLDQGVRFEDLAFSPWEDVSFYGFYGVSWSPITQSSSLYHIKIFTGASAGVNTEFIGEIRTTGNDRVHLNALEFSDWGTLYAGGWRIGSNIDETFTIDLTTAAATPHQALPAGYHSAGDIHFHRPNGDMYLTTVEQKLLKMSQPWLTPPPAFQIKSGNLPYGDFAGLALDPPYLALAFRQHRDPVTGQYGVYPINLGTGTAGTPDWLGHASALDEILGAATRYTTAKADLSGAYFDVTPDPVSAGTSVSVAFKLQNSGAKNAGPFDVDFYLSKNSTISTNDEYLGTFSSGGVAALSTTSQQSVNLNLPAFGHSFWSGTGTYYVGMIVDSGNNVEERVETNNSNTGQGLDEDPVRIVLATISVDDVTVSREGDSGTTNAVFTVSLSSPTSLEVKVDYETVDERASDANDYQRRSGTLLFPPNETARTIFVPVQGDTLDEIDESFFVNLSHPINAHIADGQGKGTIVDDDPPPTVSIGDVTVPEGHSGTTPAVFTVTLSEVSGKQISVEYATADAAATAGEDYEAASSPPPLLFEPGETEKTIGVPVTGDLMDEFDEHFFVNLLSAVDAVIDDGQGRGTIINDDQPPTLSIDDATVDPEGDGGTTDAIFTVGLSVVSGKTVTVDYATADGSATAEDDYETQSGGLTFLPGQQQQTIRVPVQGDPISELDENFFVNLSNPTHAELDDGQGEGTIVNDDLTSVSIADVTVDPEGNRVLTDAAFAVTLSSPSSLPVTVDYATADGSATGGSDYYAKTGQVTFRPGVSTQTIHVTVLGDAQDEPDENFLVRLSNPVNSTIDDGEGEAAIIDDDPRPTASLGDVSLTEGNDDTTDAVFTVNLSVASGRTVTVDYATSDGTARAGEDYESTDGTLTFLPGESAKTITVPVIGDTRNEFDEVFYVGLLGGTNVDVPGEPTEGKIVNDDALPTLAIDDFTVDPEGDGAATDAVFTVSLSAASGKTVTVDYAAADDTAVSGEDYEPASGTLTFEPGQTEQTVIVSVIGDDREEPEETFLVTLSNSANAEVADGQGQGTIVDDDAPLISISDVAVDPEGNLGSTNAVFIVGLSAASVNAVSVDFAVAEGTATAAQDYVTVIGTRTFPPGQTEATISVPVLGDTLSEADETFFVNLSNSTFGVIEDGQGQGTIVDDDPLPFLSITDVTVDPEGNGGLNKVLFAVTLSEASGATVTVDYATADDTTTASDDYLVTSGTLSFPPGSTEREISVLVVGDASDEFEESFFLNLSHATYAEIAEGQGRGTIVDDDPEPTLSIDDVTLDPEGHDGTTDAVFTVSLSIASGKTVTVQYVTADDTAAAGGDYVEQSGTLTFPPGTIQQTIHVPVIGDTAEEPDEGFFVDLSNSSNATIADGRGQGTIIDDDRPAFSITDVTVDPEGDEALNLALFTVSLSPTGRNAVTVNYTTADGTATAGEDYETRSGILAFEAGQTQATIEVPVIGDTLSEEDETFFVNLWGAINAEIADGQGQATILDDDIAPIPITYLELVNQDPSRWYALETTRQGFLTAELISAEGELALHAVKADPPLATGKRIDHPAGDAGETYYLKITGTNDPADLRLANLVQVSPDGAQVAVYGTDSDDTFEASFAASPYMVIVKGVPYDATMFPLISGVHFFGEGGSDEAVVTGSDGDENVALYPHSGRVTGPDYELQLSDFSAITVRGQGGNNVVTLVDSDGDDHYVGTPTYAAMYGEGFDNRVYDIQESYAEAGVGIDVAKFYDSPGSDLYIAKPTYNAVSGEGYKNVIRYFEGVHVYATAGGIDVAKFYDSPLDDHYVATPTYAAVYNEQYGGERNASFYNRAKFFEGVHAYATAGGSDLARFYDSPLDDDFVATPTYAALFNTEYRQEYTNGFYNRAKFFEGAHAYATAGGSDLARLYDSPGDDKFYADPEHGAVYNDDYQEEYTDGFYNRAKFFEGVHAYATAGGSDEARLHGSGADDKFAADPIHGALYLPGQYYNRAKYFEHVYADAHEGDGDQATLNGLEEIGREDDWIQYADPERTAFFWLRDLEEVIQSAASGEGDAQQSTKKDRLGAFDLILGDENFGSNADR